MGDSTTAVVILAAVVIGVLFVIAIVRRLGWGPTVRAAWDDVLACAVEAARVIRARPRVLWPAAILLGLAVASWAVQPALRVQFFRQQMAASAKARPAHQGGPAATPLPSARPGHAARPSVAPVPKGFVPPPLPSYWRMLSGGRYSSTLEQLIGNIAWRWYAHLPGQVAQYVWVTHVGGGFVTLLAIVVVSVILALR